jgi:hypothetical protein
MSGFVPDSKAAGAWSWPLDSPVCPHVIVLNYTSKYRDNFTTIPLWIQYNKELYVLVHWMKYILSCDRVALEWFWIDDSNYCTLWYSCDYTLQFTITHTLVSTVKPSLPLLCSSFQWWTFPFLWVSKLSPASTTSFY